MFIHYAFLQSFTLVFIGSMLTLQNK